MNSLKVFRVVVFVQTFFSKFVSTIWTNITLYSAIRCIVMSVFPDFFASTVRAHRG